jgi:quinohemoprotein ethanol dehydrogenase
VANRIWVTIALLIIIGVVAIADRLSTNSERGAGWVDEARLVDADPSNWYTVRRGWAGDHYSPLNQINENNVDELGFAWEYETHTTRGLEASPVVVDGIMYTSGNWGWVYAVEAATGKRLWVFSPGVDGKWGRRSCCDIVNRGVAVWKGRVFVAALDGRLIALDASTGEKVWEQQTLIDESRFQVITAAPQIAGDKVIIGNSGAELGVRGYISAYDAASGEFAWRFFTVPGDPELPFEHPELEAASKTWDPNSMWDIGGGGTVWDSMAYDPELNLLYVGTGNGSPHPVYSRSPAGGDNLYLSSILAINPDSGRLVWHYQTTPGDSWDYTATQNMIMADLELDGAERQVIMQAPKNGFFYVLDRATGELLSADAYGKVTWASHVNMETGRPVLTDIADFSQSPKLIYPGQAGAHMWEPMSYSLQTGLVYIPVMQLPQVYSFRPEPEYRPGVDNQHVRTIGYDTPEIAAQIAREGEPEIKTFIQAWDPVSKQEKWRVRIADHDHIGGILSTAGNLIFQGDHAGNLKVFTADRGKLLKTIHVGTGMMAAPISYSVDGVQYVSIMAGLGGSGHWRYTEDSAALRYGNDGRIVTFKLGGGDTPMPEVIASRELQEPPVVRTSPEMVARGRASFRRARCTSCHGVSGAPGLLPDMLLMTPETHGIFKDIVLEGVYRSKGMDDFSDLLTESDVEDIQAFIVDEANKLRQQLGKNPPE